MDVNEEPVIEVTPIYTSTLKGENVKSSSVQKDSDLDTNHVFYGVRVTSQPKSGGTTYGILLCEDIIAAIQAEMSKSDYEGKVYAGDVMRTILYVDMSSLESVAIDAASSSQFVGATADNCLFFMPKGYNTESVLVGGGVIAGGSNGTALTDIVVNDQQPFYSPYEFYTSTRVARYFRTKVNGKDLPKNTTIVLPFSVALDADGHLKTSSDNVDEKVKFRDLTTTLTTPEEGKEGEVFNVGTQNLPSAMAMAFKPYHLISEEQTETSAFKVEAMGATIPVTPAPGNEAFINDATGMVGHGSLNGVAIPKEQGIYYFSKEYFWNSETLAAGKSVKILPYRAYYTTTNSGIKTLDKFGVDLDASETTGIKDIENEKVFAKGVYDLTGRRVADDVQSLTRGIYIVNGKKYFVK